MHAQAGLLTFIPSIALLLSLYRSRGLFFQSTPHDFVTTGHGTPELTLSMLEITEWYDEENAPCFVYFDSLDDLQSKIITTDYVSRRDALRAWAARHTNTTSRRWQFIDGMLRS